MIPCRCVSAAASPRVSDDPEYLPYVKVGSVNYHNTGHQLDHFQSLRGTSKVEAVHSVLDRT